jgi:hypothetical protein
LKSRQPCPIVEKVLPYSVTVQSVTGVLVSVAPGQAMVLACIRPRLCPGSCMRTTQLSEPFTQVRFAGRPTAPSSPRPPKLQIVCFDPK